MRNETPDLPDSVADVCERRGSLATVHISYSPTRYSCGEFVVQNIYRHKDGSISRDPTHRIHISTRPALTIVELWQVLLDLGLMAWEIQPRAVTLRLAAPDLPPPWQYYLRAVAEVAAVEVHGVLMGTTSLL